MTDTSRRRFLAAISVSAAALALPACRNLTHGPERDPLRIDRDRFPQSVASGDPRSDRVLLWTRLAGLGDERVRLQVSARADFGHEYVEHELVARDEHDRCLRVRVTGLEPDRVYYYRFLVAAGTGWVSSPHGRTRTAPDADSARPLRFAFLSCQDYIGRYYNALLPLLDLELDAVIHLGDFIYETVADPGFQSSGGERSIEFDDQAGALVLGSPDSPHLAARSLDNYRQLHRSYRSDALLQRLLEHAPLIAIWDDHEFSDDCWQDHGTYHARRRNERDTERRRNAEQAYFEYMPVDLDDDSGTDTHAHPDRDSLFPNLRLWRSLRFGTNVELLLTDYRSHRPAHLIPEDAFPGALAYDRPALQTLLPRLGLDYAELAPRLIPYVDLSRPEHAALIPLLRSTLFAAYVDEGIAYDDAQARALAAATAPMALPVLVDLFDRLRRQQPEIALPPLPDAASLDRGLPWIACGKTALFSAIGSRYFVVKEGFDLLAALRAIDVPTDATALGTEQSRWLAERLRDSDARWKLIASSVSFTSLLLDLAHPELKAPEHLRRRFYLNVDHWDGFPVERRRLIDDVFEPAGGVVIVSGDIHAGFASQHAPRTIEFTTPALSSQTLGSILERNVQADPATAEVGRHMVQRLDELFTQGEGGLRYVQTRRHGCGVLELDAQELRAHFFELPETLCAQSLYKAEPDQWRSAMRSVGFRVDAGTRRLVFNEPTSTPPYHREPLDTQGK